MRLVLATLVIIAALAAAPALAQKGNGPQPRAVASCSVTDNQVTGSGLPIGELLNFMLTDASGTTGWVLGFTDTGTWTVTVPDRHGPTRYEFVSKTWGPNGSKYNVFAGCSA